MNKMALSQETPLGSYKSPRKIVKSITNRQTDERTQGQTNHNKQFYLKSMWQNFVMFVFVIEKNQKSWVVSLQLYLLLLLC